MRIQAHERIPPLEVGQEIAIPVQLLTPSQSGSHAICWRLACNAGTFGDPIWIILQVDAERALCELERPLESLGIGESESNTMMDCL